MESIKITMPNSMSYTWVKNCIEGNLAKNSKYTCKVSFSGIEDKEAVYKITSSCAEAFYLIGMTTSEMIRKFNEKILNS